MRYYWYIEAIGGKLVWECPDADSVAKQLGNLLEGLSKFPVLQAKCVRKSNTYVQVRDLKSCSNLTMARLASKLNSLQLHHVPAVFTLHYTSSTAQGGGGSFKDRKLYRRGDLLWCMDGRANPLMDRKMGGVVFFWSDCNGCSGHLTHNCWMQWGVAQL